MEFQNKPLIRTLIAYYGLLQSLHLVILVRAGVILLLQGRFPFPILPPPGGWDPQVMPFMLGLGTTDLAGILLGLCFAYRALITGAFYRRQGVISLTIFITGAVVFAIGTFPSGAWAAHPIAYGSMTVLFLPTVLLYARLLRSNLTHKPT
ncbi:MAG: hypothetical protein K0B06_04310 [Brevefilum sp.]|nr:hypothetical protein [Brevefilum sp.]